MEKNMVSNCCKANPIFELDDNMGYCSECGRGAFFEETPEDDYYKDIQQDR